MLSPLDLLTDMRAVNNPNVPSISGTPGGNVAEAPPASPYDFSGLFGLRGNSRDILGTIGDALLIGTGRDPLYRPQRRQELAAEAMAGYNDDPLAAIERYAQFDPAGAQEMRADYLANVAEQERLAREAEVEAAQFERTMTDRERQTDILESRAESYDRNIDINQQRADAYGRNIDSQGARREAQTANEERNFVRDVARTHVDREDNWFRDRRARERNNRGSGRRGNRRPTRRDSQGRTWILNEAGDGWERAN